MTLGFVMEMESCGSFFSLSSINSAARFFDTFLLLPSASVRNSPTIHLVTNTFMWGGPDSFVTLATGNKERERNVLFNDALNTFYLRLYGVRHMVKDHSDSEKGNPLPPHRLLFLISSKGSFICTIPQTG